MRAAIATFLLASALAGQDIYVSPAGNDSAAGTLAAPFATVLRAQQAVRALLPGRASPITVALRGGTYYMTAPLAFTAADSGTASAPVIYQAYPGEIPVLSGAVRLNNWTVALPTTTQNFEQLYVNGQRRYRPRTTRSGYLNNAGPVSITTIQPDRFKFKPGDLSASYANINDVEIINFEITGASRMRLKSVDTTNNIAFVTGPTLQDATHGWISGHRYIVENAREALSQRGDWYLDRSSSPWNFTYLPRPGEDLATAVIEIPQLPQILTATNLANVTFSGITFAHDNWTIPAAGYQSTVGETQAPAAISVSGGNNVVFDSCIVAHTSAWGIEFLGGANNQIVNSLLFDLGAGGIRLGNSAQGSVVQNNALTGGGRFLPGAPAISINTAHHNTIAHNDIQDFYHSGIEDNGHDDTISFNHIAQIGQSVTNDIGGVWLASGTQTGNRILNNRIHDVTHALQDSDGFGGWGIETDGGSNLSIQNNLIYRTAATSLFNKAATNNTISNNIFTFAGAGLLQNTRPTADAQSFQFTGNIGYFTTNVQRSTPSEWYCNNPSGALVACTSRFFFDSNQYFNPTNAPYLFFINPDPLQSSRVNTLAGPAWQALGEDLNSQIGNPLLANPTYPIDDFRPAATSPAVGLGFKIFDPAQAGRNNPVVFATPLDPAWPARQLDPVADYKQLASQATLATTLNSASFRSGSFSANSIAAVFGTSLATATAVAPTPVLPLAIAGTSLSIRDSVGVTRPAELYFVSPSQVNYVIPPGTASGNATITVSHPGSVATGTIIVSGAAPGLYSADGSGKGTAAATITYVHADGTSDYATAASGPIDLSRAGDQVFCTLYGTGVRNRSALANVSLQLGNQTIPALYAGAQPTYEGFDQINFQIPNSFAGQGTLSLTLTADSASSNSVTLTFK
jgi:uncharacterized protein (TIGR03437 family)